VARPRGNDWLSDEMNGLREAGTNVLVSMLTADEAKELDLQGEAEPEADAQRTWLQTVMSDTDTTVSCAGSGCHPAAPLGQSGFSGRRT
jgi:hypothetical protein